MQSLLSMKGILSNSTYYTLMWAYHNVYQIEHDVQVFLQSPPINMKKETISNERPFKIKAHELLIIVEEKRATIWLCKALDLMQI